MQLASWFTLFILCHPCLAKTSERAWVLKNGNVTYTVNYPLKKVKGRADNVRGKGQCENKICDFLIAVPVKDFLSGDGNRDHHMLEVTKAAMFPMVVVKVRFSEASVGRTIESTAVISFAGKTRTFQKIIVQANIGDSIAITRGTVPLVLSEFDIKRPSLLGISIDDSVPVEFELVWK